MLAARITDPDQVSADRLSGVPGIGPARAQRLATSFANALPAYDVLALLVPVGLDGRLAARLVTELGPGAAQALRGNPWRLLSADPGAGRTPTLDEADRLARSLLGPQARPNDPRRAHAAVLLTLASAARAGSTAMPVADLLDTTPVPDPGAGLASAREAADVVADAPEGAAGTGLVALERFAVAEDAVAQSIARLLGAAEPWCDPAAVAAVAQTLDAAQRTAVEHGAAHGVSLLTGGPGTGKSRTVSALVRLADARGRRVALAAPTGRAAKRLEELTGHPASTLHRLLGAQGTSGGFARGESWPLDADLVVVDEASMLDAELAAALVEAVPDGAHLLLVGDPAQLPSIGAGRVLSDLLAAGLPTTELQTLYRQAEGGAIARLATEVRQGRLAAVDPADREVVVVTARGSAEAAHRCVQLVTDSIPRALSIPAAGVQVVTPVHRGPAGTHALNAALKAVLNPGPGAHNGFDAGDRVVAVANHLDDGFANGEVGVVTGAEKGGALAVTFASGPVSVPAQAQRDLLHGWAITVHRAQGSEWPAVVVVLPPEAGGLLSRPLVYTALTRAQRHLSVVHAVGPALGRAVADIDAAPRCTRLAQLTRAELAEQE